MSGIRVDHQGWLHGPHGVTRCASGRNGIRPDKVEGDGATPSGCFPLRRVLYRPDRVAAPRTALPVAALTPDDGWCDDPADANYNRRVPLPYAASHERLWRADSLYDVILVIGHNDAPVVAGRGSAIFLHIARGDYEPTAGCIALTRADLLALLEFCGPGMEICISAT
ncbi:MAG: L,D-transpeptidase family protein [Azospirillaceae bacterium]|nr:L,D-transpeptidase family protein [Azospirillaceae bacterium]